MSNVLIQGKNSLNPSFTEDIISVTGGVFTITNDQKSIVSADFYTALIENTTVVDDGTLIISVETTATETLGFRVGIKSIGDSTIELFEGGTVTGGSTITPLNINRLTGQSKTLASTVTKDPTISIAGTSLLFSTLFGGTKQSAFAVSSSGEQGLILAPSETYYLVFTNISGSTNPLSYFLEFIGLAL